MRSIAAFILALLFAPIICLGQALADRVPGDAEIYVGWKGTDSLGAGYDQSHLKAVLEASQLSQFIHESIPRLIDRIAQENPDAAGPIHNVLDLLTPLASHPAALYVGGADAGNGGPPIPKVAVICDAGPEAPALAKRIMDMLHPGDAGPFYCQQVGQLVVVADFAFPEHAANPLSQNKGFQAAIGQLVQDPVAAVYVDGSALTATINQAVAQFAPPPAQQQWPQIRDALGLDGLKTLAATSGFDGKNWSVQALAIAPASRHGLLALADSAPLSGDLLKLIPQSVTMAGAGSLDLDSLFTTIVHAAEQFGPEHGAQLHQGLDQLNQMLGFDLQKDLLAALGPQWAYYADPATAGNGPLGLTILNRPRNADRLQTSLTSLETFANATLQQILAGQQIKVTIEFRQTTSAGCTIHYLATPLFSPAWTIKDGTLYAGLFPQMVVSAVNRPADAKSIQDNAGFQSVMQELHAPATYNSFTFVDLPKTIPLQYQAWLAMSRLYLGFGDLFGVQTPPLVLPPLDKLMAETEPGAVSWSDDAGFHAKAIEPFPGANVLGSGSGMIAVGETPLLVSILLPSLNRAHETANRVKDASNLRQIGQGCLLYSNENQGAYPPDLGTLLKTENMTVEMFISPDSGQRPPPNMTPDEAANWVNRNSDYIYIGAGLKQGASPETVVCYDKESIYHGAGTNLLYGDGHVEWRTLVSAHQQIEESKKAASGGL